MFTSKTSKIMIYPIKSIVVYGSEGSKVMLLIDFLSVLR
jgi:hypothetical protein